MSGEPGGERPSVPQPAEGKNTTPNPTEEQGASGGPLSHIPEVPVPGREDVDLEEMERRRASVSNLGDARPAAVESVKASMEDKKQEGNVDDKKAERLDYWYKVLKANPEVAEYKDAEDLLALEEFSKEEERRAGRVKKGVKRLEKAIEEGRFGWWVQLHYRDYDREFGPTFIGQPNNGATAAKLARDADVAAAEDAVASVLPPLLNDRSKTSGDIQDAVLQRMINSAAWHKQKAEEGRMGLDKLVKKAFPEEQRPEASAGSDPKDLKTIVKQGG